MPTREAEAARLRDAEDATARASSAEEEGEASAERVAALEARVRRLTKQAHAAVQTHERATASLLAEHAAVLKQRDADAKRLGASLEAETVAAARARRRAAASRRRCVRRTRRRGGARGGDGRRGGDLSEPERGRPRVAGGVFGFKHENTENTNRVGEGKNRVRRGARGVPVARRKSPGKTFRPRRRRRRGSPRRRSARGRILPRSARSRCRRVRKPPSVRDGERRRRRAGERGARPKAETAETRSKPPRLRQRLVVFERLGGDSSASARA